MTPPFHNILNNVPVDPIGSPITVTAARAVGANPLSVSNGTPFGSPSPTAPLYVSVFRGGAPVTILEVTGNASNVLTVTGPAPSAADAPCNPGDTVMICPTADNFLELQAGIKSIVSIGTPVGGAATGGASLVLYSDPAGNLDQSTNLNFDATNNILTVNSFSATVLIGDVAQTFVIRSGYDSRLASTLGLIWSSDASCWGTPDVGIRRGNPGVLQIAGGTSGPATIACPALLANVSSDQNDWAPGTALIIIANPSIAVTISGMQAGIDGQVVFVWNYGPSTVTILHLSSLSLGANQWHTDTGAPLVLSGSQCLMAHYIFGQWWCLKLG